MPERGEGEGTGEVVVGGVYMHLGNPKHEYTVLKREPCYTGWEDTGVQAGWTIRYRQDFDGIDQKKGDICTRSEDSFKGTKNIDGQPVPIFQFVRMSEKKERWPTTTSVAILLSNKTHGTGTFYDELVLVRKKDTQQWTLVAGNMEKGETSGLTAWRELEEETGQNLTSVKISRLNEPKLIEIPSDKKTSIGLVYKAYMIEPIPLAGYKPDSTEVDLVKPFSIEEIRVLTTNHDAIYKPEFNRFMLDYWLWCHLSLKYAFEKNKRIEDIARGWDLDERVFTY